MYNSRRQRRNNSQFIFDNINLNGKTQFSLLRVMLNINVKIIGIKQYAFSVITYSESEGLLLLNLMSINMISRFALLFFATAFVVRGQTDVCKTKFPNDTFNSVEITKGGCTTLCHQPLRFSKTVMADNGKKCGDTDGMECFNGGCVKSSFLKQCQPNMTDVTGLLELGFLDPCHIICVGPNLKFLRVSKPDAEKCGTSMECYKGQCLKSGYIKQCSAIQPGFQSMQPTLTNLCKIQCVSKMDNGTMQYSSINADDGTVCSLLLQKCKNGTCT